MITMPRYLHSGALERCILHAGAAVSGRERRRIRWLVNFVSLVYNWRQTVFTVLYSGLCEGAT